MMFVDVVSIISKDGTCKSYDAHGSASKVAVNFEHFAKDVQDAALVELEQIQDKICARGIHKDESTASIASSTTRPSGGQDDLDEVLDKDETARRRAEDRKSTRLNSSH